MEKSREHPWFSKTNLRIFRELIFTISRLLVSDRMQKRRSWGSMRSKAEKASSETIICGANLILAGI